MSSGRAALSALAARSAGGPPAARTLATWPVACTPVSVRPATSSPAQEGKTASSASRTTPSIVRSSGWRAQPRKPLPSYSSVSFRVFSATGAQSKLACMALDRAQVRPLRPGVPRRSGRASSRRCASTILFCASPASTARLRSGSSPGTTTSPLCSSTTSASCAIPRLAHDAGGRSRRRGRCRRGSR